MSSSEESSEEENYILYKDRPEWRDIIPKDPEAGKSYSVVKICYSDEFKDAFDYFRAIVEKEEFSERALELTTECIRQNAANYSVWEYRRRIIKAIDADLKDEFDFCAKSLQKNVKNFQIWHHRQILCEWANDGSNEIEVTNRIFKKDEKNYHAWQHRQWAIKKFGLFDNELEFTEKLLKTDIYNNSAWNHRYFVIQNSSGWTEKIRQQEIDRTLELIEEAIDNESAWNYLRAVLEHNLTENTSVKDEVEKWQKIKLEPTTHSQLAGFLADYNCALYEEKKQSNYKEKALSLFKALECDIDPIRRNYWSYLSRELCQGS